MAWDPVNDLISFISSSETASYQKYLTKLKQKQLELDKGQAYQSSLDQLMQLADTYENIGLQIKAGESSLASANEWLNRYDAYYATQVGQMIDQGMGQYQTLNANWQNQLTLAAERGQSGGTASILSAIQRQSLVNYVGEDLTLDAEGGTFGGVLNENILDLTAEKQTVINNMGIAQQALDSLNKSKNLYYSSFQDALASTIKQGHYNGETYNDLGEMIDRYRDYLSVSDEQYEQLKANLLEEWKPIDFEIRTVTNELETGGEGENGANYFSENYYHIYDKATGKLATQEQVENILRTYAGNLKEKDWYGLSGYRRSHGSNSYGLSDKAIQTIIQNSNYNKRKDYK